MTVWLAPLPTGSSSERIRNSDLQRRSQNGDLNATGIWLGFEAYSNTGAQSRDIPGLAEVRSTARWQLGRWPAPVNRSRWRFSCRNAGVKVAPTAESASRRAPATWGHSWGHIGASEP